MKVHFIAIGGAAMHNLALDLLHSGWDVSGSDDEIYEPALSRLQEAGISPISFGWFEEKITKDIDIVILGMHAKKDNPELLKALNQGVKVVSYPEFIASQSQNKLRIVIAGSHGKTTTTSIILHVLKQEGIAFDYLVGSYIEGFDRMVQLTDAPIIVIEGDEYLSSPIDLVPKIHHYSPRMSVITGISWDHINVFPTFDIYVEQFIKYIGLHEQKATICFDVEDVDLRDVVLNSDRKDIEFIPYHALELEPLKRILYGGKFYQFPLIGRHNQKNVSAALNICKALGVEEKHFYEHLESFTGARKRLQVLWNQDDSKAFLDFAHAPSKVKATVDSVKAWYEMPLLAFFELHTFSSLNETFLKEYKDTLSAADKAFVFLDMHTIQMKGAVPLEQEFLIECFNHQNLEIISDKEILHQTIMNIDYQHLITLFMSSGTFSQFDFKSFANERI